MDKPKSKSKKKDKIEYNQNIEFSEIVKMELGSKKDEIKFILENGEIITENIKSCSRFVDPSYDPVFITIFKEGNILEEIGGKERLLNLLNSLLFPNEKYLSFTQIDSINNNEINKIYKYSYNSGILRVLDKEKNTTKLINLEIQLYEKGNILSRMKKHANYLNQAYNMETILITFINHDKINEQNRSKYSISVVCDGKGNIIKEMHDIEVMIINLKEEIEINQNGKKIFINKKVLNKVGISWLKLLGIRQWGKTINNFYYLPKNVYFLSKELESAFKILQSYEEGDLVRLLRKEEEDNNILKVHEMKAKMDHILGSLLNIFENKKESFDEMIDIIDYEKNVFKIKDIEEIIPEKIKRKEFLRLLGKKRKIE